MTVFRGFIKLALRQLHMLLLYVAVFVTIAVIVQLSLREEETETLTDDLSASRPRLWRTGTGERRQRG